MDKTSPMVIFLVFTLVIALLRAAKEWNDGQPSKLMNSKTLVLQPRKRLMEAVLCRTDAAWRADIATAGLGWTFSPDQNRANQHNSKVLPYVHSPLVAEGLCVREALNNAINNDFKAIVVESDSQLLIQAITLGLPVSEIRGIVDDISLLSQNFDSISFRFIPRKANSVANSLAKKALHVFVQNSIVKATS